jgi:hypothetical protein
MQVYNGGIRLLLERFVYELVGVRHIDILLVSLNTILIIMVDSNPLLAQLQAEKDWHMSAVFTDKGTVLVNNKCTLLPDEIK